MIYNQNLPTSFVSSSSASFTIVFAFVNHITRRFMYSAQICMRAWHGDAVVLIFHIKMFWKDSSEFSISLFTVLCLSFFRIYFSLSRSEFHSNCFQFNAKNSLTPVFWFGFPDSKVEYVNLWKMPCVCAKLVYIHDEIWDGNWWRQRWFLPRNPDTTLVQFPIMHASPRCK